MVVRTKVVFFCDRVAERDSRVQVFHKKNGGVSSARNYGLSIAKGEWISFIDSDDYCHKEMLKVLIDSLENNKECSIAFSGFSLVYEYDICQTEISDLEFSVFDEADIIPKMFSNNRTELVSVWGKLYRAELLKDIRFNYYLLAEDFDFNFRVYMQGVKMVGVNLPLYNWVMNSSSITHQSNAQEFHHQITAELSYRNYQYYRQFNSPYLLLLLKQLYSEMLFWTNESRDASVYKQCSRYIRETGIDSVLCKGIPLKTRLSKIIRICYRIFKCNVAKLSGGYITQ